MAKRKPFAQSDDRPELPGGTGSPEDHSAWGYLRRLQERGYRFETVEEKQGKCVLRVPPYRTTPNHK